MSDTLSGNRIIIGGLYRFQAPTNEELFSLYGMYDVTLRSQGMMFELFDSGITNDDEEGEYITMRVVEAPPEYTQALCFSENTVFNSDRHNILARIKYDLQGAKPVALSSLLEELADELSQKPDDILQPNQVLKVYEIEAKDLCEELNLPARTRRKDLASRLGVTENYLRNILPISNRKTTAPDVTASLVSLEKYRAHRDQQAKSNEE